MMKHKGDWLLLLAAFIGGGGFISLKYLLDWGYDPFQVIFGRFLTASVCMCLVYCKRLKRITKRGMEGRQYFGGHCLRQCFF